MSYAAKFLEAHGQSCTILRTPPAPSYVSMKRSSRAARDPSAREAMWEGLILAASNLASGEVFQVADDKYLVQTVTSDPASGELAWFAAKTNTTLTHKRLVETVDQDGNILSSWSNIGSDMAAYAEIVTATLRQTDAGLLDSAKYVFLVPLSEMIDPTRSVENGWYGVAVGDRLVCGNSYRVESVDNVGMSGVVRVQCSDDLRP